jgi:hypothetical protein
LNGVNRDDLTKGAEEKNDKVVSLGRLEICSGENTGRRKTKAANAMKSERFSSKMLRFNLSPASILDAFDSAAKGSRRA